MQSFTKTEHLNYRTVIPWLLELPLKKATLLFLFYAVNLIMQSLPRQNSSCSHGIGKMTYGPSVNK